MPLVAHTRLGHLTEAAIDVLGNRTRVAIIGYLHTHGTSPVHEIADGIDLSPSSVSSQMAVLVDSGLVSPDIPADQVRRGVRIRYSLNVEQLREMRDRLNNALGFTQD